LVFKSKERLEEEYEKLVAKFKTLKTQFNQTKLSNSELKVQFHEAKEQMNLLDVELTKSSNRCEVLNQASDIPDIFYDNAPWIYEYSEC